MSFPVFFFIVSVSVLLIAAQDPEFTCDEIVENLNNRSAKFREPVGHWLVYVTTNFEFACRTFDYTSVRVKESRIAQAVFLPRRTMGQLEYLVAIVPAAKNKYVTIGKHDGSVTLYHRIQPDVSTNSSLFWCEFSCEDAGVYVNHLTCYINNDDLVPMADKLIQDTNLPFRSDARIINYYYDCVDPEL